jgi:hypothetical protein
MSTGTTYTLNITTHAMKISKKLAKFLAEEGVLTKFIDNHIDQHGTYTSYLITMVTSGFTWIHTPEGQKYWEKLNAKYMDI